MFFLAEFGGGAESVGGFPAHAFVEIRVAEADVSLHLARLQADYLLKRGDCIIVAAREDVGEAKIVIGLRGEGREFRSFAKSGDRLFLPP